MRRSTVFAVLAVVVFVAFVWCGWSSAAGHSLLSTGPDTRAASLSSTPLLLFRPSSMTCRCAPRQRRFAPGCPWGPKHRHLCCTPVFAVVNGWGCNISAVFRPHGKPGASCPVRCPSRWAAPGIHARGMRPAAGLDGRCATVAGDPHGSCRSRSGPLPATSASVPYGLRPHRPCLFLAFKSYSVP